VCLFGENRMATVMLVVQWVRSPPLAAPIWQGACLPWPLIYHLCATMETLKTGSTFRRLRNRYRLVVMNDDTYEEVASFKLNRLAVYVGMSTIFVLLVGLTIGIVSFTPLRYLIPGYGKQTSLEALRVLKLRTDSMEAALAQRQRFYQGIEKVLRGDTATLLLDTTPLPSLGYDTSFARPK
jgi:hypothetical protein